MSSPSGNDPRDPHFWSSAPGASGLAPGAELPIAASQPLDQSLDAPVSPDPLYPLIEEQNAPPGLEPQLFQSYSLPQVRPQERIPNFGHLCMLGVLAFIGLLCTWLLMGVALAHHLFGISKMQAAVQDIHYELGTEGALYLFTFIACLIIFPMVWHKSFFAGVQWNFATALRLRWRLVSAAFACFVLALLNGFLLPGPQNTPIDQVFKAPGAAWILFGFGVTFAPFFEEMFFRGFLLPATCTAIDWSLERKWHRPPPPLGENGHPQWSLAAMTLASVATSIPFALLHAEQTGWAIGPFCLLLGVSLVLCAVRLSTRSLASSVLVHASYNFLLFSIMLVGTGGFRHLDKM